ncbi:class I glutamine amidotransferase-like protein [Mollisia scopiformis]|uniref:Class I glutamine amidotransferase-like protein n=1 Tax=Mollisia scopiformis TaxID=149040 RepID=A0A194X5P9_MOLSC|nr:class I glutamine amidotransferase-like protein [Mollisia scopiformis]KUJ15122.1 class I glutamine amidotransferase-like protein [Mollisia scopiformis]
MLSQTLSNIIIGLYLLANQVNATPTHFGYLLYQGFEVLDVFGPLEALNGLAGLYDLNLTIVAETMDPISSLPPTSWFNGNKMNSTFSEHVLPTHTFETAPPLDVLIIPGGNGLFAPAPLLDSTIQFIKARYPTLQYLITVCNGAGIAARAGVLDGKHATTNKAVWDQTIALGPKVKWVAQARWVTDGNVWTSSGVSAGIDVMLAWISAVYSEANATGIANGMEYERHMNSTDDPFATLHGLTDANNSTNPSRR